MIIFLFTLLIYRSFLQDGAPGISGDLLGHYYKTKFIATHGLSLWTSEWYAGSPLLTFYPPLSYIIFLPALSLLAYKMVFFLVIFAAGLSMYLFVKHISNRFTGILAAFFYISNPWFIEKVSSGNTPLITGMAIIPLAVLFFVRAMERPTLRNAAISSTFIAALLLTHHTTFIYSLPVFFLIGLYHRNIKTILIILLIALGISSFFWIPAFVESGYSGLYPNPIYQKYGLIDIEKIPYYGSISLLFALGAILIKKIRYKAVFISAILIAITFSLGQSNPLYFMNPFWKQGAYERILVAAVFSMAYLAAASGAFIIRDVISKLPKAKYYFIIFIVALLAIQAPPIYMEKIGNDFSAAYDFVKSDNADFRVMESNIFRNAGSLMGYSPFIHGKDSINGWYIEGTNQRYLLLSMEMNQQSRYFIVMTKLFAVKYIIAEKSYSQASFYKVFESGNISVFKNKDDVSFIQTFGGALFLQDKRIDIPFFFEQDSKYNLNASISLGNVANEYLYPALEKNTNTIILIGGNDITYDGSSLHYLNHSFVPKSVFEKREMQEITFPDARNYSFTYSIIEREKTGKILLNYSASREIYILYSQTYFPGWTAYLDGKNAPVLSSIQNLIVVKVPEGSHELLIEYTGTLEQKLSVSLAILSLLVIVITIMSRKHYPGKAFINSKKQFNQLFSVYSASQGSIMSPSFAISSDC